MREAVEKTEKLSYGVILAFFWGISTTADSVIMALTFAQGARLRLKAFCTVGKPHSTHAYSGLRLRAPTLYVYCGCYSSPLALGRLRRPGKASIARIAEALCL